MADSTKATGVIHPATQTVIGFVSQAAIFTALLYYLGWVRTRATFSYFNIDTAALRFSVADYMLRSVNTTMRPLVVVAIVALASIYLHSRLRRSRQSTLKIGRVVRAALIIGTVLSVGGLALIAFPIGSASVIGPPALCTGFIFITYWTFLTAQHARTSQLLILGALVSLTFLWATSTYAIYIGEQTAREMSANIKDLPQLVVFTNQSLVSIQGWV